MEISECVQSKKRRLIAIRRDLHQIPELAFEEYKTAEYIWRFLETLSPDQLVKVCGTGIKCVFGLDKNEPAVAFRADMDALPIEEGTGRAFASCHPGSMHACGHDGHMAVALTTALIVSERREHLRQPLVIIFQPAEETTGGALPLIEHGILDNPQIERIYGLHIWPYIPQGTIGLHTGPLMAAMSDLDIRIEGITCHGARPQDGSDAALAACQLVTSLQSIVSRSVDPYEAAVISIGRIRAGEARNVICGSAELEGTVRTFKTETSLTVKRRIAEMIRGLEIMFQVSVDCTEAMCYPAVDNPQELVDQARAAIGPGEWTDPEPVMMSEDFAFYQQYVPGLFAFLGAGSEEYTSPLHSASFDFDEEILLTGVEYVLRVTGCL